MVCAGVDSLLGRRGCLEPAQAVRPVGGSNQTPLGSPDSADKLTLLEFSSVKATGILGSRWRSFPGWVANVWRGKQSLAQEMERLVSESW